ncbi:MAG TPA: pyridoxamine 5'-phosphate oxidase family protein [Acidimicrobiia bacterium]|nr:pyridoxamine 5'-phosphate oxidase family protein [Acidimicrobiia bacterium]
MSDSSEPRDDDAPRDHRGLIVMTLEECERMLEIRSIGRIALLAAGEPLILPVLFQFVKGTIVFRTAPGEKLDAVWQNAPAAFEVDSWDTPTRTGWSVLVRGRTEAVHDEEQIAELEALGLEEWVPSAQPNTWVRIHPVEITGRRIG